MKTRNRFSVRMVRNLLMLWVVLGMAGACATPQQQAKGTTEHVVVSEPTSQSLSSPPQRTRAKIFGVQANDYDSRTELKILMNRPVSGYHVERRGSHAFDLIVSNVETSIGGASIPTTSKRLEALRTAYHPPGTFVLSGRSVLPISDIKTRVVGKDLVLDIFTGNFPPAEAPVKSVPALTKAPAQPIRRTTTKASMMASAGKPQRAWLPEEAALGYKTEYHGKPISLDLQNADVRNVLRLLADISGMNIVLEPDVSGKVTLKVENVPWDQVLDMVLMMNRLGKEEIGGVVRIARQEKLKQEWKEREARIKAQQELLQAQRDLGELQTEYLQVNYADPSSIAAKIGEIKSEDGKVSVDDRTNLIIYTDYPARIEEAKGILRRLDRPTKQVLIEARIVQLSTNASKDLGVQWFFQMDKTTDHSYKSDFAINHPIGWTSAAHFAVGKLVGTTLWNLDVRLMAAEQTGQGKIISAPRVLTMNHVKATISQGTQIPYQAQSEDGISTEFKDATLELQVTPHVTPDGRIRLEIQAKKEAPNFTQVIPGQPPAIDSRKIDTELLVDDGATVVIGGIIEETETESESRTPGIHMLPFLGHFFKSKSTKKEKNELLIFINPQIVDLTEEEGFSES